MSDGGYAPELPHEAAAEQKRPLTRDELIAKKRRPSTV